MNECPFELGDKVRHRASGEIGIVIHKVQRCGNHGQMEHIQNNLACLSKKEPPYGECQTEYTGLVELDLGFEKEPIIIKDCLLEKVNDYPPAPDPNYTPSRIDV